MILKQSTTEHQIVTFNENEVTQALIQYSINRGVTWRNEPFLEQDGMRFILRCNIITPNSTKEV